MNFSTAFVSPLRRSCTTPPQQALQNLAFLENTPGRLPYLLSRNPARLKPKHGNHFDYKLIQHSYQQISGHLRICRFQGRIAVFSLESDPTMQNKSHFGKTIIYCKMAKIFPHAATCTHNPAPTYARKCKAATSERQLGNAEK